MRVMKHKSLLIIVTIGVILVIAGLASHRANEPLMSLQKGPQIVDEVDLGTGESYTAEIKIPGYAVKPYVKFHIIPEDMKQGPLSYILVILDDHGHKVIRWELSGETSGTKNLEGPGTYKLVVYNRGRKLSFLVSVYTYYYVAQQVKNMENISTAARVLYYLGALMIAAGAGLFLRSWRR